MSEWWEALSSAQQLFYAIGISSTIVVVVQMLLLFVGGDLSEAGDVDVEGPEDHPSGLQLVSLRTVVAFFMGFGWAGVYAAASDFSIRNVVGFALVGGAIFMLAIFYLMRMLHDLRHSGTLDYRNSIGEVGTVYLPIPPSMEGPGRIQVMIQGRLKVIQALTRHGERLENRARVRVVDLLDENTLVVEPLVPLESGDGNAGREAGKEP